MSGTAKSQLDRVDAKTLFEILEAVELVARRDDTAVVVRDGSVRLTRSSDSKARTREA